MTEDQLQQMSKVDDGKTATTTRLLLSADDDTHRKLIVTHARAMPPTVSTAGDFTAAPDDDRPVGEAEVDGAFISGFRDCRLEVVRYMSESAADTMELEQLPLGISNSNGEAIIGNLERHLADVENELLATTRTAEVTLTGDSRPIALNRLLFSRIGSSAVETVGELDDSALGTSLVGDVTDDDGDDLITGDRHRLPPSLSYDVISDDVVRQSAAELMRLANVNANVGRLLDELFQLMDEEDADDGNDVGEDDEDMDMMMDRTDEVDDGCCQVVDTSMQS
jgi:hypothetical protein